LTPFGMRTPVLVTFGGFAVSCSLPASSAFLLARPAVGFSGSRHGAGACCRFFPLRWVPVCWWVVRGVWMRWCGSRFRLRCSGRRRVVRRLSLHVWWRSFRRWRLVRVQCWWWCRGGLVPLGWCPLRCRRLASVGWVPVRGLRRRWLWAWVCQCWCGLSVRPGSRRRGASVRWAAVGSP